MNQSIQNNSVVNLPAGTANATIYVTTNAALVNSCKVVGGTTASTELVANGVVSSNGVLINGLVTGDNTITIVTKSEDLLSTITTTFNLHVLSGDKSLSVFTIEGQNALTATTINLGSSFIGKTISQLSITKTATASTSTAGSVMLHTPTLQVGSNIMEFAVIAENSSVQTYTRTLYVKSSEAGLASVTINSVAKQLTGTPEFVLSANTTSLNVVATPVANGKASVTISGQVTGLTPGMTTTITIAVQPEDTSIAPTNYSYGVHILSNDANVDAVYINDNQLTIAPDNTASVTVKDLAPPSSFSFKAVESTTTSTLKYKMESDGQPVNIVSGDRNNNIGITPGGVNHLIITDTAENGDHKDTTITITSLSTDITLSEFKATYGGSTNNVTSGQTITLATGVNEVVVEARSTYSGAEVTLDGVIGTGYSNNTISVPAGTTKEVIVNVKATDGTSTTNPYKVTFVAPDNTPVLNNDTSLKLLSTKGYGQIIADNTIVNIINTSGFATGIYSKSIDLDTSFILINPTVDPISDPAFSSQKGIIIFATPTNKNATTTCSLSTELTKNEVISFAYVYVTSSDGSATQTYTVKLIRNSILSDNSSLITLGTNTSYKSEVTIDDSINSILLNPSPGEVMYTGQIALKTPALNANVSVNLVDGISIGDGNGNFTSTKNLTTYATKNKIQLEFTLDGNSTKYYQTMYLIRSSGYASLDTLLNSNDLTLPFAAATSIMTSATNGTIQKFGFALSNTKYTLKSGPTSPSFTGPKIYIVASYDEGLNWSLLKYSNANDSSFSFLGSGTLPQSNSIVYNNNNENTVLSLNNTYYLIFNRNDQYFSKSLTTSYVSASTSASGFIKSSSTFLSTYYNVLYLSRVVDVNVSYDYYAIVLNNNTDYGRNIFIMARQVGNSALKPLSIVVQCGSTTSGYIFGDSPTISKVTINNIDYFQVVTVGGSIANSVPSGTYRTMISSLTSTMNGLTYTTSSNNVIALIAISSDATVSSLGWFDSASNYGTLNAPTTSEQVTLTQGATGFGINVGRDSKATISAKVDGVDVTCNSDGIQDLIPITPGSTVSVVITVTAQNGTTTSSYTVNVTSPAPL